MSLRYATTVNEQANNFNAARRGRNVKFGVGSEQNLLSNSFVRPDGPDNLFENEAETIDKFKGIIDSTDAGKNVNPDFHLNGVDLTYNNREAPSILLREHINTTDSPLQGAPNLSVPAGSLNNPSEARNPSDLDSYHGFDSTAEFPDGGGFGNYDIDLNIPQRHRRTIGDYFQNYTRGQNENFGNSVSETED